MAKDNYLASLHRGTTQETFKEYSEDGQMIEDKSVQVVLDNVCGAGDVAFAIFKPGDADEEPPQVFSLDPYFNGSQEHVRQKAEKQHQSHTWEAVSQSRRSPNNTFDVCITIHQDSYYDNGAESIRDIYWTLKPGGYAIFSICPYLAYTRGSNPLPWNLTGTDWKEGTAKTSFTFFVPSAEDLRDAVHGVAKFKDYKCGTIKDITLSPAERVPYTSELKTSSQDHISQWPDVQQTLFQTALRDYVAMTFQDGGIQGVALSAPLLICRKPSC